MEQKLTKEGEFLIRKSESYKGAYILCVLNDRLKHVVMENTEKKYLTSNQIVQIVENIGINGSKYCDYILKTAVAKTKKM